MLKALALGQALSLLIALTGTFSSLLVQQVRGLRSVLAYVLTLRARCPACPTRNVMRESRWLTAQAELSNAYFRAGRVDSCLAVRPQLSVSWHRLRSIICTPKATGPRALAELRRARRGGCERELLPCARLSLHDSDISNAPRLLLRSMCAPKPARIRSEPHLLPLTCHAFSRVRKNNFCRCARDLVALAEGALHRPALACHCGLLCGHRAARRHGQSLHGRDKSFCTASRRQPCPLRGLPICCLQCRRTTTARYVHL